MSRANTDKAEKGITDWITDLTDRFGAERVSEMFGTAAVGVARTKATIDKNLDAVLALANIPSRSDYQKVQAKLDSLQGSIMSLSRMVEELREALESESSGTKKTARGSSSPAARAPKTAATARRTTRKRS
ncbi:MAG: hypothetical protein E4H03_09940 [Myxococcales bacterium]|nr:MAG: hypothetical protein E4H03_09940 [Myxococcales bacterium]